MSVGAFQKETGALCWEQPLRSPLVGENPMTAVRLDNLTKVYPPDVRAADSISLEVRSGELLVLLGPSGSGKTTLLRLIAGLETPSSGEIYLGGKSVAGLPPHQ